MKGFKYMKNNYIIHKNDDNTITIYSDKNNAFYKLNYMATLIFNNIHLSDTDLVQILKQEYELTTPNLSEILLFKNDLLSLLDQL